MNMHLFGVIHEELLVTQNELLERLHLLDTQNKIDQKQFMLLHEIVNELEDVNRALNKMQMGVYGISEDTGKFFTYQELQMIPTARFESDIPYFLRK